MPIIRKQEDVTRLWSDRLAQAKRVVASLAVGRIDNQNHLHEEFRKIQIEIQDITEKLSSIKSLEEQVIQEFDDIEEELADDIFDDYTMEKQMELEKKFESMNTRIAKIKSIGSLIHWESVTSNNPIVQQPMVDGWKMSDDWKRNKVEENILSSNTIANFKLSYDNLEIRRKLCLLCFSIFPKNSVIKKRPLIYWWIGEGIISSTNEKTAEQMGEEVLEELQNEGLINPVRTNRLPRVTSYTVHPWIHRMIISAAAKAEFFDFDEAGNIVVYSFVSRRTLLVPLSGTGIGRVSHAEAPGYDDIQTLLNINEKFLTLRSEWLSRLKKLRVLQLGRWQASARHHIEVLNGLFLNGLGSHNCLRYLSLRGITGITELPNSISKLIQLRILDLRACHNLKKLPGGIEALQDLTHLDVSECYLLEYMPKGLKFLLHLQVLKGFVISNSSLKDACRFDELVSLTMLRKLSIYVASDADTPNRDFEKIHQFRALRVLTINWGGAVDQPPAQEETAGAGAGAGNQQPGLRRAATMSLARLSMPQDLEKLDLRCFPASTPPIWLTGKGLQNLRRLYIRGGKLHELPMHDKWNVQILRFKFLSKLKVEWSDLQKAFPSLIYMENIKCKNLNSFPFDQDGVWVKK